MAERIAHPFEPVVTPKSRILILGTMPSPKSREQGFYYGHPQNRFWRILMDLFNEPMKDTISEKLEFLRTHHIAIWDVFSSCDIKGADDSSIKNAMPNDLDRIFNIADINAVFTNGQKASTAYKRFFSEKMIILEVRWR